MGATDPANPGKYLWKRVINHGFGDTWNQYGMTMAAFGDYLYIGTAVGIGMVMKNGEVVGTRAIEIIRVDKNDRPSLSWARRRPPTRSMAAPTRAFR